MSEGATGKLPNEDRLFPRPGLSQADGAHGTTAPPRCSPGYTPTRHLWRGGLGLSDSPDGSFKMKAEPTSTPDQVVGHVVGHVEGR